MGGVNIVMAELRDQLAKLTSAFSPEGGYLMTGGADERKALIDYLWAGDYSDSSHEMLRANPELASILAVKTANSSYKPADREAFEYKREKRMECLTGLLAHNRNVNVCSKQQAILSVTAKQKHINRLLGGAR